jgi:hypothetical protein
MTSFGYSKHKQKKTRIAWEHFGIQSLFWVKVIDS